MPGREVSDSEVEKWYEVITECFRSVGVYVDVIRKFPPEALRNFVRRLLERMYSANADPKDFDWCVLVDGIETYPSLDALFESLEKNQLIPPDPERFYKEMLEYYERELNRLGYRVISEETFKSISKVSELEREISELKKIIKELQEQFMRFTRGGRVDVSVQVPTLRREFATISWEKYLEFLKQMFEARGFPTEFVEKFITVRMDTIRGMFVDNKMVADVFSVLLDEILANITVMTGIQMKALGISIRPVRETIFRGRWIKVGVSSTIPSWVTWANKLAEMGYKVRKDLVPFSSKVNIVHDPYAVSEEVACAVIKGDIIPEYKDRFLGCSSPAIIYVQDDETREVYWLFYRALMVLKV